MNVHVDGIAWPSRLKINTLMGTPGWVQMGGRVSLFQKSGWSHHGTRIEGAKGIIRSHYKAGGGDVYGRGIYSTPKLSKALSPWVH